MGIEGPPRIPPISPPLPDSGISNRKQQALKDCDTITTYANDMNSMINNGNIDGVIKNLPSYCLEMQAAYIDIQNLKLNDASGVGSISELGTLLEANITELANLTSDQVLFQSTLNGILSFTSDLRGEISQYGS